MLRCLSGLTTSTSCSASAHSLSEQPAADVERLTADLQTRQLIREIGRKRWIRMPQERALPVKKRSSRSSRTSLDLSQYEEANRRKHGQWRCRVWDWGWAQQLADRGGVPYSVIVCNVRMVAVVLYVHKFCVQDNGQAQKSLIRTILHPLPFNHIRTVYCVHVCAIGVML